MSENENNGNVVHNQSESSAEGESNQQSEQKSEFVDAKAYQQVKEDMFKYKTKMREIEAERNQLKADREAAERERLEEEGKWQELYNKAKKEKEELSTKYSTKKEQFIDFHKKNAVISKIGGFKKDDYAKFIVASNIVLNEDNSVDAESVEAEAKRIRETYPELIKANKVESFNSAPPKKSELKLGSEKPGTFEDRKASIKSKFFKQ